MQDRGEQRNSSINKRMTQKGRERGEKYFLENGNVKPADPVRYVCFTAAEIFS